MEREERARPEPRRSRLALALVLALVPALAWLLATAGQARAAETVLRYFPVGPIYEYRWKLLELALERTAATDGPARLVPYAEDLTQNRGVILLQSGGLEVIALGTNDDREKRLLPVRVDILRGMVGFRLLIIRAEDQARIAAMDPAALRQRLTFGLNSQWADLPVMRANGFNVVTSTSYENLFGMLATRRFDAFPRGLNEAQREMDARRQAYPQLAVERTLALYFPFPVYFWVSKDNPALALRIERGLRLALADGSFRRLFEAYHAEEIAKVRREPRRVIQLDNPLLPPGAQPPDTDWWWPKARNGRR